MQSMQFVLVVIQFLVFYFIVRKCIYPSASSLSFELFVVSFMQEDVYIGHTALALTHDLQVFNWTGATRTGRLLGPNLSAEIRKVTKFFDNKSFWKILILF